MLDPDRLEETLLRRTRFLESITDSVATVETLFANSLGMTWSKAFEKKINALPITARTYCQTYALTFPHPYVYVHFQGPQHLRNVFGGEEWALSVDLKPGTPESPRRRIAGVRHGVEAVRTELAKLRTFDLKAALEQWHGLRLAVSSLRDSAPGCVLDKFYVRMGG